MVMFSFKKIIDPPIISTSLLPEWPRVENKLPQLQDYRNIKDNRTKNSILNTVNGWSPDYYTKRLLHKRIGKGVPSLQHQLMDMQHNWRWPGSSLNIMIISTSIGNIIVEIGSSYLHNGNSNSGKTTVLYWIGVLVPNDTMESAATICMYLRHARLDNKMGYINKVCMTIALYETHACKINIVE